MKTLAHREKKCYQDIPVLLTKYVYSFSSGTSQFFIIYWAPERE